jgi:phage-related protein
MDGMTLEKLQVLIEAQTKGFRDEVAKVQNEVKKMTNSVNNEVNKVKSIFKSLGRFVAAVGIGKFFVDSTRQAMKVEAAIQQITRTMGESTNQFLKWAKNNALAFNMSQSDAMNYGAVFSNLVSTFSSGTKETLQYTTDLLKASSIIASGTGRTMEDVMERIRSGLLGNTEAIEDLGVNVNVAMLKSTEAFNKFANGKSWDQLSFQTQQQIRLMAILEQTQNKFGGEVFNNTNSSLQQLVAVLKDVALNIGNAFLPILNVVLPILTGFALKLREVTAYIATFMQTLFGKKATSTVTKTMQSATSAAIGGANAQNAYNNALSDTGDTAKKTAKEMNRLLGGFDEINSLSNSGSSGGGLPTTGGVGGADIPTIDLGLSEEPDISGVSKAAEKVRAVFKNLADFLESNKVLIISILAGLIATITSIFAISKWSAVTGVISGLVGWFVQLKAALGFSSLLKVISYGLFGISPIALGVSVTIGAVVGAIVYLWNTSEEFRNIITGILNDIIGLLQRLWNEVLSPLFSFLADVYMTILMPIAKFLGTILVEAVLAVFKVVKSIWDNVLKPLADFLIDILAIALQGVVDVWNTWKPLIQVIFKVIMWLWDNALKPFVDFIVKFMCGAIKDFGITVKEVLDAVKRIFSGIIDFITGVFTGNWSRAWQGVVNIFGGIMDGLGAVIKAPLNGVIWLINQAISGLNKIKVPDWVPSWLGGGQGINIPQIPYLARGGIIDSPTLAMVGEAGKEAVVPLENNKGGLRELASILLAEMGQRNSNNNSFGDGDLILQIDGTVIGKVALKQLRKMQRQGNITLIPV